MPFCPSHRLLKLAFLGLAGLVAGFLSGCTSSAGNTCDTQTTYTWGSNAAETDLPASIEARQAPSLHLDLNARRLPGQRGLPFPSSAPTSDGSVRKTHIQFNRSNLYSIGRFGGNSIARPVP